MLLTPPMSRNSSLFNQVNAAGLWFSARKVAPIWARRLDQAEAVATLEGIQEAPPGSWLCRGATGDLWPQTEQRLLAKYRPATEADEHGWRQFDPRPDSSLVMAARIDHEFVVYSAMGELVGKAGDYLVKDLADRDVAIPETAWIVDQDVFISTYRGLQATD
ncbi:hypothetical protein AYO47_05280 [Planctomyces sp. SCGC AG-212-M04]|nr:hypothetical protein AYO47_05280 [Planctomyces sp. SCGC AG-212-M04]